MGKVIGLNKHFTGVSLVSADTTGDKYFDAPISAVHVTPLPAHSDFQATNILRTLAITYRNFSTSMEPLRVAPTWSTERNQKFIALRLDFSAPVEPQKFLNELAMCIASEYKRKKIPYIPSRTIITCRHARLALPAPEAAL